MQKFNIRPINLIRALSSALELTMNGMSSHHLRTAIICKCLASKMRIDENAEQLLLYSALLHDIGAASDWHERRNISKEERIVDDISRHAVEGAELLSLSPRLSVLAETVRYHHDNWIGGNRSGMAGKDIPLTARILHVADRIEIMLKKNVFIFSQKAHILDVINKKAGKDFDPAVVRALNSCSESEAFWMDIIGDMSPDIFFKELDIYGPIGYSLDDAMGISEVFATIVDKTSSFTSRHSRGVACVAAMLAERIGFSSDEVKCMKIAGLLHDLGKLAIDNEILEKPGKLTEDEYTIIRQHTYYTYRILQQIDGFDMIAQWAAYHHETLDGKGYPFRIREEELPLGSRIVAVADVFTALTEERPYRGTMPQEKVQAIMQDMIDKHKLDRLVVNTLFADYAVAEAMVNNIN